MRHFKIIVPLFLLCFCLFGFFNKQPEPVKFVLVTDLIPNLDVKLSYFSTNNFVGDTINGYKSNNLFLTIPAARQLKLVQEELLKSNLCLRVYDGYRPQRAVNQFVVWAKDLKDTINKNIFYPNVQKRHLFRDGYIASRSGHSRGSTVDLTIIDAETQIPLDMGSPYDFFGEASWIDYNHITEAQKKNRKLLQSVMKKYGFRGYAKEWWHFTLRNEPYPNTYFNFDVN